MSSFPLSVAVDVSEIDLTTVVPAVSTSVGAIAGIFRWGPVGQRVDIDRESTLVARFGKPTNINPETFFTAANFLAYANRLVVVRAANTTGPTPTATFAASANISSANNIFTGNTTGVTVGMQVLQSSNSSVLAVGNTTLVTAVNATTVTLSSSTTSNANVALYFGSAETAYSAVAAPTAAFIDNLVGQIVKNDAAYENLDGTFDTDILYVARFPGGIGNSLRISVVDSANAYASNVALYDATWTNSLFSVAIGSNTGTILVSNGSAANADSNTYAAGKASSLAVGDQVLVGNAQIGEQYLKITSIGAATTNATQTSVTLTFEDPYRLSTNWSSNTINRHWEFFNTVDSAPGQSEYQQTFGNTAAQDEMHVVIVDDRGRFTDTPGTILEVYQRLSRATNARNNDTTGNYYKSVLNEKSQYVWFANDRTGANSAPAATLASSTNQAPLNLSFRLGTDGLTEANAPLSVLATGYDLFSDSKETDISFLMQGKPVGGTTVSAGQTVTGFQLANYLIDNFGENRKDIVVCISPERSTITAHVGDEARSIKNWYDVLHRTSYGFGDSGYKYQFDRYNELYRWIPLNGDMAGLMARTDQTNDAWWSPGGYNRGRVKNLVKLAYSPNKSARDILYPAGINPVITEAGEGTILLGDKTLQSKPSAFDRVNVRRLFIVVEKAIAAAAKYSLFDFNDPFTRRQFVNMITPYLRDIKGRRGITDFYVKCDEENNPGSVVDTDRFVGDIYIKPARSINFIQLNFVAVGTDVQFSEVVQQF